MIEADDEEILTSDPEARNLAFHLLQAENELFDEERARKPETLIGVKHLRLAKKKEDWVILENKKAVLRLKDYRLSKKEKEFLQTLEGLQFLIREYKNGARSVAQFKRLMADKLEE